MDGNKVLEADIYQMVSKLAHRGPDGAGIILKDMVGLGHRRLSIIDLATGDQPMSNSDGSIWITYNGEIYNFIDVRSILEARGYVFSTRSDTEVVIHAYQEWGESCVDYLRGMFAFGIWDSRKQEWFLARDHFGIKPLYYYYDGTLFAFASEIQAFRSLEKVSLEINLEAIDQYLWLQYIPAPHTIFKNVYKLPPAHRMKVSPRYGIHNPEEYWKLEFKPQSGDRTKGEWIEELDYILRDSVKAHLISDVPFGVFLSGGVDSSAILAYMSQELNKPVRAFTIGFNEDEYSELGFAKDAARRWNADHCVEIVTPNALEILPKLVKHYGEPFGDSSSIPTYYVSQLARSVVPMILSGDGGDEMFGGYHSYVSWINWLSEKRVPSFSDLIKKPFPRSLFRILRRIVRDGLSSHSPTLGNWLNFISYLRYPERKTLWREDYQYICRPAIKELDALYKNASKYPPLQMAQFMDIKTYLPYDILTKMDVASMAHGLEVRTPLVDIRVMEFAASIPPSLNFTRNSDGKIRSKSLLKDVAQKYYPPGFIDRPKMGFGVPVQDWFSPNGALHGYVNDRLLSNNSYINRYFNPEAVRALVAQNEYGRIWLLLFLEEWLCQFNTH